MQAFAFAPEHERDVAAEVGFEIRLRRPLVKSIEPEPAAFEHIEGLIDVLDDNYGQVLGRPGGGFRGGLGQAGGPSAGDHDGIGAGGMRRSNDGAQIPGVLHAIEHDQQTRWVDLFENRRKRLRAGARGDGDNSLVLPGASQPVDCVAGRKLNGHFPTAALFDHGVPRRALPAARNHDPPNLPPLAQGLADRVNADEMSGHEIGCRSGKRRPFPLQPCDYDRKKDATSCIGRNPSGCGAMFMLRFETAGESHGETLATILTGLPAGIPVSLDFINRQLWRRQQGYGRGGRMKIESDKAHIVSGVRHSRTIGSPIAILLQNRDWKNWTEALPVENFDGSGEKAKPVRRPRPGHADLAGVLKYNFPDARYVLERASARETTSRVAVGALCKLFLREFGMTVLSHVVALGNAALGREPGWDEIEALAEKDEVLLNCVDPDTEQKMKAEVDQAYRTGDTRGGIFEVVAHNVTVGLGAHVTWDSRLDGKLAQAIMSMQALKAVEIGRGMVSAVSPGSKSQDTIHYNKPEREFERGSNRAGGLEGGMTNGEDVVVRGYIKPISTLRRPLESVDLETREPSFAAYERSDVAVVPAAGVIGEAMVAIVLAGAFLEKFGGDSLQETRRNFESYQEQVRAY